MSYELIHSDCLDAMRGMDDNSVDSVVTDAPYEIKLMGRRWDASGVAFNVDVWAECLRVAKPGAILMNFCGSKKAHRIISAIEDAGWEVQNSMYWAYGEGMPKGIGSIGKANDLPDFDGYSTGLKPCVETICVAIKSTDGTFGSNAKRWGVAGYNVNACRVGHDGRWPSNLVLDEYAAATIDMQSGIRTSGSMKPGAIRNHRGSVSMGAMPEIITSACYGDSGGASRYFNILEEADELLYCSKPSRTEKELGLDGMPMVTVGDGRKKAIDNGYQRGTTLRKNPHESVKPASLMLHLCKLTRPPHGGIVLDPFVGSGTTGVAAALSGRNFIGIDMRETCIEIARARIAHVERYMQRQGLQESTVAAMMSHRVNDGQMSIFDLGVTA